MLARARRRSRSVGDFNVFLHGLRSRELEQLPRGAGTVLHGGAAGAWYFEWFAERYSTAVRRHIAVEAFAGRPDGLDERVEWLEQSLGDLGPVGAGEVDLVFAGQVIEHLWPDEVTGFLLESRRVLRPGGTLAVDSPNRRVTTAIGWEHPEHTLEFRPDEILELVELAGFEDAQIRGLWLCFDRERNEFLPLDRASRSWPSERRAKEAAGRPEDSFVWWLEAQRGSAEVDEERLSDRVEEIFAAYRGFRFARLKHSVGSLSGVGRDRLVAARGGEAGHLVFGPYVPMREGRWTARFRVAAGPGHAVKPFGVVDVALSSTTDVLARKELTAEVLPPDGGLHEIAIPFQLPSTEPSVEFRVQTYGAVPMAALLDVLVAPETPAPRGAQGQRLGAAQA